jgi:hypothetical protein
MQSTCQHCQSVFDSDYSTKLYCSSKCQHAAQSRRQGIKPRVLRRDWKPGTRFGKLSLVEPAPSEHGRQFWICDCDCGTKRILVRADKLVDRRKQSCGCITVEVKQKAEQQRARKHTERCRILELRLQNQKDELDKLKRDEQAGIFKKNHNYSSPENKHEVVRSILVSKTPITDPLWNLRFYTELIRDDECYYCKGPLTPRATSLDWIDSSFMYTAFNCVVACKHCTELRALSSLTFKEMELLSPGLELIRLHRVCRPEQRAQEQS